MKQALILLGLTAYTMALPLKNRLAQAKHGEPETPGEGILDCDCELPGTPGEGFPGLDQGEYHNYGNAVLAHQELSTVTRPDVANAQTCESYSCACHAEAYNKEAAAQRVRTYTFGGAIDAVETIEYEENGSANEQSAGHSLKATACIINHESYSGAVPDCSEVCVCLDDAVEAGNGAHA